jgi:Zn-dependent peptidase ImmA (M78 family)/DNA-binding XRE family transcriptional regulator
MMEIAMDDPGTTLAEKLRVARRGASLSTREVAERLSSRFPVSHATIANYEKGRTVPSLPLIAALADLYARPVNWFLERGPLLTGIRYRNTKSKIRISDRLWFEAQALRWLDAYIKLERFLGKPLKKKIDIPALDPGVIPSVLAARLRKMLGIGDEPVPSVMEVLEKCGIRAIEIVTDQRIDAMAAMLGDEHVMALNPSSANDRCRLNACHELGHILLGDCETQVDGDHPAVEKHAYDFAAAFLVPESRLKEAFRGYSMVRLVQYKERFGISLSAMIYRAQRSRIISERQSRYLWIEFARRGWKTQEPGRVRPDRAVRFEQLVDGALIKKRLTLAQIASITGVREDELKERVSLALGLRDFPPVSAHSGEDVPVLRLQKPTNGGGTFPLSESFPDEDE